MKKTLLLLFVTLATVSAASAAGILPPEGTSQQDKNKAVAARVFDEIFNQENSRLQTKSMPAIS
jgi:hypothetical protein